LCACDSIPRRRFCSPCSADPLAAGEGVEISFEGKVPRSWSETSRLFLDCGGVDETVEVGLGDDAGDAAVETEDVDVGTGVARRGVTLGVSSRLCLGETDGEAVGGDDARGVAAGAG